MSVWVCFYVACVCGCVFVYVLSGGDLDRNGRGRVDILTERSQGLFCAEAPADLVPTFREQQKMATL